MSDRKSLEVMALEAMKEFLRENKKGLKGFYLEDLPWEINNNKGSARSWCCSPQEAVEDLNHWAINDKDWDKLTAELKADLRFDSDTLESDPEKYHCDLCTMATEYFFDLLVSELCIEVEEPVTRKDLVMFSSYIDEKIERKRINK